MALWRHLTHGLRVLTRRAAADRDIDDELRHWVDEAAAQHVARGLDPAAARRAALAEIGPPTLVRERVRDHGWEQWIASWLQDLRLATRTLRQTPLFTAIVVLVIALGTGAVTTVFSAMNAILLRPAARRRRPAAWSPCVRSGATAARPSSSVIRVISTSANTLAASMASPPGAGRPFTIAAGGEGTAVLGNLVTANYFDVLGVAPFRGRFFTADEDRTPGTHPVLVVSHAFWQAHLGGADAAVGRAVSVNGHPFTLIGVAPPAFRGLYTGMVFDAWAPVMMQPQLRPRTSMQHGSWLWAFARLRPGVDAAAAGAGAVDADGCAPAADWGTRHAGCLVAHASRRRSPACPAAAGPRPRSSACCSVRRRWSWSSPASTSRRCCRRATSRAGATSPSAPRSGPAGSA